MIHVVDPNHLLLLGLNTFASLVSTQTQKNSVMRLSLPLLCIFVPGDPLACPK